MRVRVLGLNGRVPREEGARVGATTRVSSSVLVLVPWQSLPATAISNGRVFENALSFFFLSLSPCLPSSSGQDSHTSLFSSCNVRRSVKFSPGYH